MLLPLGLGAGLCRRDPVGSQWQSAGGISRRAIMFMEGSGKVFHAVRPLDKRFYQHYTCFADLSFKDLSHMSCVSSWWQGIS